MISIEEIESLKKFKELNPFKGKYEDKYEKFFSLLKDLCSIHLIEIPKFVVPRDYKLKKRDGDCRFDPPRIRIKHFSPVILLHEIKHMIDFYNQLDFVKKNCSQKREWDAIYYSNFLFYATWPERITHLMDLQKLAQNKNIKEYIENLPKHKNPSICAILDLICMKMV